MGLDGLHKAGVPPQLQRWQGVELCSRPEALGLVDRQQLKIRVGHRYKLLLLHQLPVKRIKAFQNGAVHRCRQQFFLVLRSVRGGLFLCQRSGQLLRACREYQPAVSRLCHAKMFQFHAVSLLLSGS